MMTRFLLAAGVALSVLCALSARAGTSDPLRLPPAPVAAVQTAAPAPAAAPASSAKPAPAPSAPLTDAQRYCQNIAAAAADARFAWQSKKLSDLEAQMKQRVGELQAKQAEYKAVLDRYDDAMKRAKTALVDIYAHMRPETAATQLSVLDDDTAAAVLAQLTAQKASAILNEITPERAAKIVTTMTSLMSPPAGEKKS
ncbi:MAG TPA: hypothetical protein VH414_16035 [Lichenihabitans sp.]|jgi:flagellar motility protein MotE (MotC chaperone)|nr:hypothetical protein [Lichenihabitans sp.]